MQLNLSITSTRIVMIYGHCQPIRIVFKQRALIFGITIPNSSRIKYIHQQFQQLNELHPRPCNCSKR